MRCVFAPVRSTPLGCCVVANTHAPESDGRGCYVAACFRSIRTLPDGRSLTAFCNGVTGLKPL
jgi:hypothetical protein